jgi:hypothetical protein
VVINKFAHIFSLSLSKGKLCSILVNNGAVLQVFDAFILHGSGRTGTTGWYTDAAFICIHVRLFFIFIANGSLSAA